MKLHLQPKGFQLLDLLLSTGKKVPTIIGGGGAKGGGKSFSARVIALSLASELGNKYPGLVITIVRRVAADLRDNHINPLFKERPELFKHWRATDHDLVLPNKARIIFRSVETLEDVRKRFLGGFESAIIIVDEAQQFTGEELQWIQAAARWTDNTGIPTGLCKTLLLFNPGGPGSPYLRRIFWTHQYEPNENPKDYSFVHWFGWDNYEWFRGQVDITEAEFYSGKYPSVCNEGTGTPECRCCRFHIFITQTSEGRKYNAFPASIRAGYLLGSFDHFEGQYFAGAWDDKLCVISPALAENLRQPWWTHWMSMDWGWAGPPRPHYSVNLWWAIGKLSPQTLSDRLGILSEWPLDVAIVYRARHTCLTPEEQWSQQIVDATPEKERRVIARHYVDGAVFSTDRRSDNTIADLMQPALRDAGFPNMEAADKDRIGGWRQLYNAFVRTVNARSSPVIDPLDGPLLLISADVPELIKGFPLLICDEDRPEDVLKTEAIEDDYCDTCFTADTLIQTEHGERAISRITIGTKVWTRQGLFPVKQAWRARNNSPVVQAILSDGRSVTCTEDHKFFTDRGFVPLNSVRYGDKLTTWDSLSSREGSTHNLRPDTIAHESGSFISTCGPKLMVQFLKAMRSITRILTPRITNSRTLSVSRVMSIEDYTVHFVNQTWNTWPVYANLQRVGTARQGVSSGIGKMPSGTSLEESSGISFVNSAGVDTKGSMVDFAPMPASLNGVVFPAWTRLKSNVRNAVRRFRRIVIRTLKPAQNNVVRLSALLEAGFADVYDLEIDGSSEFYANGILVHNCRYGYKSMLEAQWQAPRDIRAKQVYDSIQGPGGSMDADTMTARAMAMLKFNQDNPVRRSGAPPRWRSHE